MPSLGGQGYLELIFVVFTGCLVDELESFPKYYSHLEKSDLIIIEMSRKLG